MLITLLVVNAAALIVGAALIGGIKLLRGM